MFKFDKKHTKNKCGKSLPRKAFEHWLESVKKLNIKNFWNNSKKTY